MFGDILKATYSSFQRGIAFCRSIYVKKVVKLLAFIFEQPSYIRTKNIRFYLSYGIKIFFLNLILAFVICVTLKSSFFCFTGKCYHLL